MVYGGKLHVNLSYVQICVLFQRCHLYIKFHKEGGLCYVSTNDDGIVR